MITTLIVVWVVCSLVALSIFGAMAFGAFYNTIMELMVENRNSGKARNDQENQERA